MSHTSKEPPSQYAAGDLPSNPPEGTVAYDKTNQKMVAFKNSSWGDFGGSGGVGSTTYVRDNVAGVIDQIQGDIPDSWKNSDTSLKGLVIGTSCTSIGNNAFYYCDGLTGDLVIPDSVTSIGSSAFYYCTGLTGDLVIPDSVTTIEDYPFWFCNNITTVVLGSGLTSIGEEGFGLMLGLTTAYINCPASSFTGEGGFYSSPVANIYVHADYVAGYDATWKTAQNTTATVSTWTNYPNIP